MLPLFVIGIPLLIYIAGALSVARKDLKHPDDYFVAYRKVGVTAFSSSSIAYAFQISTIYPFLLWGASSFYFVPAINTICWGLGIFLFYLSFDRYKKFIGKDLTLHGFLGEQHGLSTRIVASYLTITGFLGFAMAETYFGSKVLHAVIENRSMFYSSVGVMLILVFIYIAYGGQVSSIRTDQLQLMISYIGIFGIILYFLYILVSHGSAISGLLSLSLIILICYIPIILISRRLIFIKISEINSKWNVRLNRSFSYIVSCLLILIALLAIIEVTRYGSAANLNKLINIEGFGALGVASLIILPLCWQFVDLTNWQRLLSVKSEGQHGMDDLHQHIRKGLLIYAVESPFTWILFLFFGLLAVSSLPHFTFNDLLVDFPKQLIASHNVIEKGLGLTFIVSIVAIMLSTIDSFIVGIIFTFVYDSYGKTRRLLDSKEHTQIRINYRRITNAGKLFGLIMILLGIVLFVAFDANIINGGELFINLLLAFYSAQLSFFPLIFGILFLKTHPSAAWANATMIVGSIVGISIGVYAVIWNPTYAWYPIPACLVISSSIYSLGLLAKRYAINN